MVVRRSTDVSRRQIYLLIPEIQSTVIPCYGGITVPPHSPCFNSDEAVLLFLVTG